MQEAGEVMRKCKVGFRNEDLGHKGIHTSVCHLVRDAITNVTHGFFDKDFHSIKVRAFHGSQY